MANNTVSCTPLKSRSTMVARLLLETASMYTPILMDISGLQTPTNKTHTSKKSVAKPATLSLESVSLRSEQAPMCFQCSIST